MNSGSRLTIRRVFFLNFSTNNKRWSVQPELRLIRKGGYSDEPSDNYDYRVRVDYDFLFVNIPVSIQYNFPRQWENLTFWGVLPLA